MANETAAFNRQLARVKRNPARTKTLLPLERDSHRNLATTVFQCFHVAFYKQSAKFNYLPFGFKKDYKINCIHGHLCGPAEISVSSCCHIGRTDLESEFGTWKHFPIQQLNLNFAKSKCVFASVLAFLIRCSYDNMFTNILFFTNKIVLIFSYENLFILQIIFNT